MCYKNLIYLHYILLTIFLVSFTLIYIMSALVWGLCWVFVLAALLLKQISLYVLLEPMFQHVVRHLYKMLNTMFQHPGTVHCA